MNALHTFHAAMHDRHIPAPHPLPHYIHIPHTFPSCHSSMPNRHIPAPSGSPELPLRMLLFDAFHDEYRGVICLVQVVVSAQSVAEKCGRVG